MNDATQLRRCLRTLESQTDAPAFEIIVPVFGNLDCVSALRREWPAVRFIEIPDVPPPTPGYQHWIYDRRRAVGIAAARGEIIALTDEFAILPRTWCAMIRDLHATCDAEVIGGALRSVSRNLMSRAAFLCDFARFEPPFQPGETAFASLVNASYKRTALENCREYWRDLFDETVVHEHIRRAGARIYLDPRILVEYDHGELSLGGLLRGKFESGRTFGGRRLQNAALSKRISFAASAPLIPLVLFARKLRAAVASGQRSRLTTFVGAAPVLGLCLVAWSAGEFAGYITARPFPRDIPVRRMSFAA